MAAMKVQWISTSQSKAWQAKKVRPAGGRATGLTVTSQRRQTWDGWGGCFNELGWQALSSLGAAAQRKVLQALFDPAAGCGLTIGRVPIGASDYAASWYSLNETAGDVQMKYFSIDRDRSCLIPYSRAATAIQPTLTVFGSPWSPPTWMKTPPVYNYGTLIWRKEILQAYALYFVRFVQAYRAEGVNVRQVHPQNEPVADQKFPSCLWTGAQLREFIRDYLAPAFEKAGLDCEIWLGTLNTDDYSQFVHGVLADERAARAIAGVAFQWAGKGAIQRTAQSWPGKRFMQSENECGDGRNTWSYAQYVFGLFRHYVANGANAYVYWNMILPPGGRSTWGWPQNAMITVDPQTRQVTLNPEFFVMKHFSRFIPPSSVRRELEGPWAGQAVAFEDPAGRTVVVLQNPFAEARAVTVAAGGQTFAANLEPESFHTFVVGQ